MRSHDGKWLAVEEVSDGEDESVVYNLRVSEYHTYYVGDGEWGFSIWAHNQCGKKLVISASEVPTGKDFDPWFDSLSARTVKKLYRNVKIRTKIEGQLRGAGGEHEYLMVATAPQWKKWGIGMSDFRQMTVSIRDLNKKGGLALGWKHSTGIKGSKSPKSATVHNQLEAIIQSAGSLKQFKKGLAVWAQQWIRGGASGLPSTLQ